MICPHCHSRFRSFRCPKCKEYVMDRCKSCHADTTHNPDFWDDDEIEDLEDEYDTHLPPPPPRSQANE